MIPLVSFQKRVRHTHTYIDWLRELEKGFFPAKERRRRQQIGTVFFSKKREKTGHVLN